MRPCRHIGLSDARVGLADVCECGAVADRSDRHRCVEGGAPRASKPGQLPDGRHGRVVPSGTAPVLSNTKTAHRCRPYSAAVYLTFEIGVIGVLHSMSHSDKHVHVQATVGAHGSVVLDQLPYEPGQRVEVTISPIGSTVVAGVSRYPLSGIKVEYEEPFGGVAEGDWESTR